MHNSKFPENHQAIMPYLMLENASAFKDFTTSVLGGEITITRKREDSDLIMHSEVVINGCTIMFCDSTEQYKPWPANLFIYVENADDSYKKALENGATSEMEPADQSYGRSCGVKDPCGNVWWLTSLL